MTTPTQPRMFPAQQPPPGPWDAFYPADCPRDVPVPDESLWRALERNAVERPDETGLAFLGRTWTWRQLKEDAEALAAGLQGLGLGRGDRVVLFMQNCPQFVIAFYATIRADAVVVPANPMYRAVEVAHYVADSGAKIGIASSDIAAELVGGSALAAEQGAGLEHLVVFDLADGMPADPAEIAPPTDAWPQAWRDWLLARPSRLDSATVAVHAWDEVCRPGAAPAGDVVSLGDDLALIGYTSGTTGVAKGCMQPHRTLGHQQICAGYWTDMHELDRCLVVVPMFHITGLTMGMLGSVANAAAIVVLPRWDRGIASSVIAAQGVTHWPNIPTMVIDLLSSPDLDSYDLSSLVYVGGRSRDAAGDRDEAAGELRPGIPRGLWAHRVLCRRHPEPARRAATRPPRGAVHGSRRADPRHGDPRRGADRRGRRDRPARAAGDDRLLEPPAGERGRLRRDRRQELLPHR